MLVKFNMKLFQNIIIGLIAIIISIIAIEYYEHSCWLITFCEIFSYLLYLGLSFKTELLKIICFNLSAIFFTLTISEGYFWYNSYFKKLLSNELKSRILVYDEYNKDLGYCPKKNFKSNEIVKIGDKLIYNSLITFKNGLRYTPSNNLKSDSCILFFGCSFMAGQGLNDNETLPFFMNKLLKNQVLNYANHGYGPHQMLKQIETRLNNDIKNIKGNKSAIYSFIPNHILRTAGKTSWDTFGPRYEIINNQLVYIGPFNLKNNNFLNYLWLKIRKSYLYIHYVIESRPTDDDILRTIAIINQSKVILQKQGIDFSVFIWDDPCMNYNIDDYQRFNGELKKANIKLFYVSKAIPDYKTNRDKYVILNDGHPNGNANRKVAEYLYNQLFKK